MGIPGLATRLEPYAARYTSEELQGYVAIIDGPALAYFAHRVAAEANKSRLPSYADVNAAAIRWLNHLEATNIKVSAILFDGALPTSKRDERSARLLQSVRRVTQLNVMYSGSSCPIPLQLGSVVYPLLAPGLMEALQTSDFAQVTRMVPGEADEWCASKARDNPRSIIFTSDTDLLLYDYPAEVLINFLKDEDILPESALKVYSPAKICQQLKLKSLVQLAYAIHTDRWKSLSEISRDARTEDAPSSRYDEFNRRYIAKVDTPSYPMYKSGSFESSLQGLDARISEYVHQALRESSTRETPLALSVFLPLFMEDPFQASAWKQGQNLRLMAYSLLKPGGFVVQEHIRKAQGVSVMELRMDPMDQRTLNLVAFRGTLLTAPVDTKLAPIRYWTLVAVHLALPTLKPPHISLFARVVTGDFDNTWAFIHLQACIQATLYSLRILKQCIAVYVALHAGTHHIGRQDDLWETVTKLNEAFKSFPTIPDLFTVPGQQVKPLSEDENLLIALKKVYTAAGIDDEDLFQEQKSKRQRKRDKREKKNKKVQTEATPSNSDQLSNNVFAILNAGA